MAHAYKVLRGDCNMKSSATKDGALCASCSKHGVYVQVIKQSYLPGEKDKQRTTAGNRPG